MKKNILLIFALMCCVQLLKGQNYDFSNTPLRSVPYADSQLQFYKIPYGVEQNDLYDSPFLPVYVDDGTHRGFIPELFLHFWNWGWGEEYISCTVVQCPEGLWFNYEWNYVDWPESCPYGMNEVYKQGNYVIESASDFSIDVFNVTGVKTGVNSHVITLNGSEPGVTYTLRTGNNIIEQKTGTGFPLTFSVVWCPPGICTVEATKINGTKILNFSMSGKYQLPDLELTYFDVWGEQIDSLNHVISLSGSEPNMRYALLSPSGVIVEQKQGTGSPISFSAVRQPGIYTIKAVMVSFSTGEDMPVNLVMTGEYELPDLDLVSFDVWGEWVDFLNHVISLNGSKPNVRYALLSSSGVIVEQKQGTGSPISFSAVSQSGTYTVKAVMVSSSTWGDMPANKMMTGNYEVPDINAILEISATCKYSGQSSWLFIPGKVPNPSGKPLTYRWEALDAAGKFTVIRGHTYESLRIPVDEFKENTRYNLNNQIVRRVVVVDDYTLYSNECRLVFEDGYIESGYFDFSATPFTSIPLDQSVFFFEKLPYNMYTSDAYWMNTVFPVYVNDGINQGLVPELCMIFNNLGDNQWEGVIYNFPGLWFNYVEQMYEWPDNCPYGFENLYRYGHYQITSDTVRYAFYVSGRGFGYGKYAVTLDYSLPYYTYGLYKDGVLVQEQQGMGSNLLFYVTEPGLYTIKTTKFEIGWGPSFYSTPVVLEMNGSYEVLYDMNTEYNYIRTRTYRSEDASQPADQITFYDGLGRISQKINVGSSPKNCSVVIPIYYDNMGRDNARVYLPYTLDKNMDAFQRNAVSYQTAFYRQTFNENTPYTYQENVFEASPLNRVINTINTGQVFRDNDKKITYEYLTNNATDISCIRYSIDTQGNIIKNGLYTTSSLYVTRTTTEDGSVSYAFKDMSDRTVLERAIGDGGITLDTYYVYDDLGRLSWIVSPEGSAAIAGLNTLLPDHELADKYCYIYRYDNRSRMIGKKQPGRAWEYMVYDKADRLVMSQDGVLRAANKWLYNVYDNHERVVSQNIVKCNQQFSREDIQARYNAANFNNLYPFLGGASEVNKPFSDNEFTLITNLSESRYGGYKYLTDNTNPDIGSEQVSVPVMQSHYMSLLGSGMTPEMKADFLNTVPLYFNSDGNIRKEYWITNNDIFLDYYYIPQAFYTQIRGLIDKYERNGYIIRDITDFPTIGIPKTSVMVTGEDFSDIISVQVETGKYLLWNEECWIQCGASGSQMYDQSYIRPDDSVNPEFLICKQSYQGRAVSYYYIPYGHLHWAQTAVDCDPVGLFEIIDYFPGEGVPTTNVTVTRDIPYHVVTGLGKPEYRASNKSYELFDVPAYLSFEKPDSPEMTGFEADSRVNGLLTYEKLAVLEGNDYAPENHIERAYYYDYKGRVIQTVEKNHLGGISRYSTKYDFVGNILKQHESHKRSGVSTTDMLTREFTYDHGNRLLSETTILNNGEPAVVNYDYTELGQIASKTYGDGADKVTETFDYNIQGWLKSQQSDQFGMSLRYYDPLKPSTKASYTGNITEWEWQHKDNSSGMNTYAFDYDAQHRLTDTKYYAGTSTTPTDKYTERGISYDKNGNILSLKRYDSGSVADDFTYQYSGNKLASLNNGIYTYAYDVNGNCITDGLKNLELKYNFLNLITQVGRASSVKATYRWTADGAKTGVIGEDGRGFEYLGSLIYQHVNGQLQLESAAFGGGRIVATHGSNGTSYTTNHFITDHLGSVRVVMDTSGQVLERNDYYAFGSRWENPASPVSGNRYRFNGKELQTTAEVNYLDYGARMYDQRLGRWHSVDPMAEKYYSISPYVYCNNNPVRYVDPTGMFSTSFSAWLYSVFNGGEVLKDKGGEYFVGKQSESFDEEGAGVLFTRRFDWGGRSQGKNLALEAAKEEYFDYLDRQDFYTFLQKGGMEIRYTDNPQESALSFLNLGLMTVIPSFLKGTTGVASSAAKGGTQGLRSLTSSNFRYNLGNATGGIPVNSQAHHVFPQKFASQFSKAGININDPRYGVWWNSSSHLQNAAGYNAAWSNFLSTNPSQTQILNYGRQLMNQYGIPVFF